MRSPSLPTVLLVSLGVSVVSACGPAPMMMMTGHVLGATCAADADCASGRCLDASGVRFCTAPCAGDTECTTSGTGLRLVCGFGPDGAPACVPPCGMLRYTCVSGVSTACSTVTDDTHCGDCRCADATTHCVRDVGCLPPGDVGAACHLDTDCLSHDCSTFAGVCRVAVGAGCSATNCDICLHLPSGATHCSRECAAAADCNGDACVGDRTLMQYECRPSACPGTTCTEVIAPHEVGQACHADTDCRSGECFEAKRCVGTDCIGEGWCTAPCTGDADCATGTRCVTIPCAAGQTAECGTVCLRSCAGFTDCGVYGGVCGAVEDTAHMLTSVCDVRHAAGAGCTADPECLSTHCTAGTCAP